MIEPSGFLRNQILPSGRTQPFVEPGPDAGGAKTSRYLTLVGNAGLVEHEDILRCHLIALHAYTLGYGGDAAGAIAGRLVDVAAQRGVTCEMTDAARMARLVTQAAGPYNLFYLRGVGNFNGNALSDSAVAFTFDGVYIGRPS